MNNDLRNQIYENFIDKDTDELVAIWTTNDHVEWSDLAFDVIKEILEQKLGKLPPQNEPVLVYIRKNKNSKINKNFPIEKFTNTENTPEFYKPEEVLWIIFWLNRVAVAAVVISILGSSFELLKLQQILASYLTANELWILVSWVLAFFIGGLLIALQCSIIFFALKALAILLNILMEMEFNSRTIRS